jgi:hypothetical protein
LNCCVSHIARLGQSCLWCIQQSLASEPFSGLSPANDVRTILMTQPYSPMVLRMKWCTINYLHGNRVLLSRKYLMYDNSNCLVKRTAPLMIEQEIALRMLFDSTPHGEPLLCS